MATDSDAGEPEHLEAGRGTWAVAVALPLALPEPLWYSVPDDTRGFLEVGQRVRVPLANRKLVGFVVGCYRPGQRVDTVTPSAAGREPPANLRLRPVEGLLDWDPVVPPDLMELALWISEYYLAPLGEVLDAIVPSGLPSGARARVNITSAGAASLSVRDTEAMLILRSLLEHGGASLIDLVRRFRMADPETDHAQLVAKIRELSGRGLLRLEGSRKRGARYTSAVEIAPGSQEELLERCGRSPKARRVVECLLELDRPATVEEIAGHADCSVSVVRRLISLRVLRQFTQVETLELRRHLGGGLGSPDDLVLRPDQERATRAVVAALEKGEFQTFLLRGITGSGKTEVYLRAAEVALREDGGVLVLVPEIALVPALAHVLRQRFGRRVGLLHSNLSEAERLQEWQRIRDGEVRVVIGPRSAALAPIRNLRLVVVDEEHDSAYKQDAKSPRYSGRDVALLRAQRCGAVALLASATPSMEALGRAESGRYRVLMLTERVGQGRLPEGTLVDLRKEPIVPRQGDVHFSAQLISALRETADAGHQSILLRNRRGFAPVLLCRACGHDHRCDDCGLPRTLHLRSGALVCHYCGSRVTVPRTCATCGEAALEPIGAGTERVEEVFKERFPDLTVDVLDRDAVQRVGGASRILERFASGQTQVLIGTQMVSKGHHFPNVALTGVLSADTYLKFPDFRAVERTYSLLTQVAGRAGRGDIPGRLILQTFHPEHYAIQAVLNNDSARYEEAELTFRRNFGYPPFSRVVSIVLRDSDRSRGREQIAELGRRLTSSNGPDVRINGPAPAPLEKLRGKWRFQILLRSRSMERLREVLGQGGALDSKADLVIDVDPQNLL